MRQVVSAFLVSLLVASVILVVLQTAIFLPQPTFETTTFSTDDHTFRTSVANTTYEQWIGLRKSSQPQLLLFPLSSERTVTISMIDMDYPIDVAFIDNSGSVTECVTLHPEDSLKKYFDAETHTATAKTVLEAPKGWCESYGVRYGTSLTYDPDSTE